MARKLKYAVVEFSMRYEDFLQSQILDDGFRSAKKAEERREFWLSQDQSIDPQNLQVIQYAVDE